MENKKTLHWMHISDLHRGQEGTDQPWAAVRQEIHDDIRRQISAHGNLDLIVFSGDLAFKGKATEFESVKDELLRIWEIFPNLETSPKLFIVPGNHDLSRPDDESPLLNLAGSLRSAAAVKNSIFSNKSSQYRSEIETAFSCYTKFISDLRETSIPLAMDIQGKLPGDCAHALRVNGLNVGLIGLNTAWTHLAPGDLKGKLDLYADQLNHLVSNDLPTWALKNHVNLLVTHHPDTWLNELAQKEFKNEIFNQKYFDAHLFGHMHDSVPELRSIGAQTKKQIQVASLFGLEKIKNETDRRHGYIFAKLNAIAEECEVWPRRFEQKRLGGWQVARDSELLQGDEASCVMTWPVRKLSEYEVKKH